MNLTQRELANLCGFTVFQISRYEHGTTVPGGLALEAMARHLGVSSDYLLGLSHEPKSTFSEGSLNEDEQRLLDEFRSQGWTGVIRLGAERLGSK